MPTSSIITSALKSQPSSNVGGTLSCSQDGTFPTADCKSYFHCSNTNTANAQKVVMSCPPGTLFSGTFCDWAANVKCNQNVIPSMVKTMSQTQQYPLNSNVQVDTSSAMQITGSDCVSDGTFPAADCKSYYHCINGQKAFIPCPPGTSYDKGLKVCNWEKLVRCN